MTVAESFCNGAATGRGTITNPAPANQQACPAQPVCVTYSYIASPWGSCSATCGTPGSVLQTRTVSCVGSNGQTYADTLCYTMAKPTATQARQRAPRPGKA
jgi:hypothetical protein